MPSKDSSLEHAFKMGLQPYFEFSYCTPDQLYLKAMSNILYPSNIESNIPRQQLFSILLGRDNHSPMPQKATNFDFQRLFQDVKWKLDKTQQAAFEQLLQQMFCIVAGPPGSGKTTLAATFCAACLMANEKVIVFALRLWYTMMQRRFTIATSSLHAVSMAKRSRELSYLEINLALPHSSVLANEIIFADN